MTLIRNIHAALALALVTACAADPGDEPEAAESRAPLDATADEPALARWQPWLAAGLARAEQDQPAQVAELRALTPVATRAGHPRFTGDALEHPAAALVLLDRLARAADPAPVRAALAEALPRTGGPYTAALVGLMAREADAGVRVAMVDALRRGAGEPALAGLRAGLVDPDPRVRAAAAEVAARRPDGATLTAALLTALADDAAEVQLAATRSLGALAAPAAFPALQAQLGHGSADLRLHSLRALGRIDAERASRLPELVGLRTDADPRVAEAADKLAARRR